MFICLCMCTRISTCVFIRTCVYMHMCVWRKAVSTRMVNGKQMVRFQAYLCMNAYTSIYVGAHIHAYTTVVSTIIDGSTVVGPWTQATYDSPIKVRRDTIQHDVTHIWHCLQGKAVRVGATQYTVEHNFGELNQRRTRAHAHLHT